MTKQEASENARRQAMAELLMDSPSNVVLRPSHWLIGRNASVAGLPGATDQLRALPAPPDNEVDHQAAKKNRSAKQCMFSNVFFHLLIELN